MDKKEKKSMFDPVITQNKTCEEIIKQEFDAILKIWPNDYVMIEHAPLKKVTVTAEYSINKQL